MGNTEGDVVMMAEDRAAIVAWRLFRQNVSTEWFKTQLEQQTKPAWNRAVGIIADAIHGAEVEVREAARRDGRIR
jgi:hypothetical protein